jgi:methylthioribulose-1-phosphate dehydratase
MAAIHRRGWCDGTGGNFSCVLQRQPLELLMAPSGVDKGSVAAEQLIVVDAAGIWRFSSSCWSSTGASCCSRAW